VLIVEDDPVLREALRWLLEGKGYTCAEAEDGLEAVALARQSPPRLVLLDLMMPALDGIGAARQLRADPRLRGVPILCLTALSDDRAHAEARQAGCDLVLTKPVDLDGVLDLACIALNS
jgi:CheY-like chemotaxis protein